MHGDMQRPDVFGILLDYAVCTWIQCLYGFAGATMEMGNKTEEMVILYCVNLAKLVLNFQGFPSLKNSGLLWATADILHNV